MTAAAARVGTTGDLATSLKREGPYSRIDGNPSAKIVSVGTAHGSGVRAA